MEDIWSVLYNEAKKVQNSRTISMRSIGTRLKSAQAMRLVRLFVTI